MNEQMLQTIAQRGVTKNCLQMVLLFSSTLYTVSFINDLLLALLDLRVQKFILKQSLLYQQLIVPLNSTGLLSRHLLMIVTCSSTSDDHDISCPVLLMQLLRILDRQILGALTYIT